MTALPKVHDICLMRFDRGYSGYLELRGTERPLPVVRNLILLNVGCFLLWRVLNLGDLGVLHPFGQGHGQLPALMMYGFLHANLLHLAFNMLGLWILGNDLVRFWNPRTFTIYYLLCLLGAGVTHLLLDPLFGGQAGIVGASGGVYGLLAAYAWFFGKRQLYLFGVLPMQARVFAVALAAISLFSGVIQSQDGMAHFAHLGGMLTGILLIGAPGWWRRLRLYRHQLRMRAYAKRVGASPPAGGGMRMSRREMQARVDELLAKISAQGMDALSAEEKRMLEEASSWLREERNS